MTLLVQALGFCPCGQRIGYCMEPAGIVHTRPWCAAFSTLEVLDYLAYLRALRGCTCKNEHGVPGPIVHDEKCPQRKGGGLN